MKERYFKSLLFAIMTGFVALSATAATSLFSDYGQIQNVQNYSSNPFWTPNSPYNQRLPQPVYVQGADLNTEDCLKVVQSLVSVQCMARNNCKNTPLADIRPAIMVQLSNLPGNNYVSACSGYIDGVYESYVAQFGVTTPNRAVAFPTATTPNTNTNNNSGVKLNNPYERQIPQWKQDIIERHQELEYLQEQNAGSNNLSATAFPTTYADLSFSERMANTAAGYQPYKDMKAYKIPDFQNAETWCAEHSGNPECIEYANQKADRAEEALVCTQDAINTAISMGEYDEDSNGNKNTHIIYARKISTTDHRCQILTCDPGFQIDKQKVRCIRNKCTPEMMTNLGILGSEFVTYAEYDEAKATCIVKECDQQHTAVKGEKCVDKDCTAQAKQTESKTKLAEIDSTGSCVIRACTGNFEPDSTGTKCVPKGTGIVDCTQQAQQTDPQVDYAVKDSTGTCIVKRCKDPVNYSIVNNKCEEQTDPNPPTSTMYYTAQVCQYTNDVCDPAFTQASGCWVDCTSAGFSGNAASEYKDALNKYALNVLFNEKFCADKVNKYGTLRGKDSKKNLSMTKDQYDKFRTIIRENVAGRDGCRKMFGTPSNVYKLKVLECTDPQNLATCKDYEYITIKDDDNLK